MHRCKIQAQYKKQQWANLKQRKEFHLYMKLK